MIENRARSKEKQDNVVQSERDSDKAERRWLHQEYVSFEDPIGFGKIKVSSLSFPFSAVFSWEKGRAKK